MREVVIVEAVRTPIGRGHLEKAWLAGVRSADLLGACYRALIERSGVDPEVVEEVIAGCVWQFGEQGLNIARNAWLQEGLPIGASAATIDVQCGSAQQAINYAVAGIASGAYDVAVGSGVEHMGRFPFAASAEIEQRWGRAHGERLLERFDLVNQGLAAELICERWNLAREELDALALRSHRLAHAAAERGAFRREIVPIETPERTVERDQGIRPDTSAEALAALRPAFKRGGKITAGNSSQISDGAAAVLLMSAGRARQLGVRPRARVLATVAVGVDPVTMLTGPIPATAKALARAGLTIDDVDHVEINEAFAPVVAAWLRETGADLDRVNPRGGAMALGHPLGSSGARLMTTILHALEDGGGAIGLVTMCCAGGLGTATLIERI